MEYTRLGGSGLKVSRLALGCMSFGDTSRGFSSWALDDDGAAPIFKQAVDAGITLWDTANVSEANPTVKVYTDPRPPYGRIGLVLHREG